ncbi:MAG: GNAT family N-acetyltransferase [Kangiellaceae bacterium]|nr:GNAT family N-acetyltransferase [Kangiellaceae bacterium]
MIIKIDDLTSRKIFALLEEHMDEMRLHSPPGSIHALDLKALREPNITFWALWDEQELLGCGALKEHNSQHGEIKSMRVASAYQGRGFANHIVKHLLTTARSRGYTRISLETGSMQGFERARQLYLKYGFEYCGPFAGYSEDPNSVFMSLTL